MSEYILNDFFYVMSLYNYYIIFTMINPPMCVKNKYISTNFLITSRLHLLYHLQPVGMLPQIQVAMVNRIPYILFDHLYLS